MSVFCKPSEHDWGPLLSDTVSASSGYPSAASAPNSRVCSKCGLTLGPPSTLTLSFAGGEGRALAHITIPGSETATAGA